LSAISAFMLYGDLFASEPRTEREAPSHQRNRDNQFVLPLFCLL
jgi:hypothetical protein